MPNDFWDGLGLIKAQAHKMEIESPLAPRRIGHHGFPSMLLGGNRPCHENVSILHAVPFDGVCGESNKLLV